MRTNALSLAAGIDAERYLLDTIQKRSASQGARSFTQLQSIVESVELSRVAPRQVIVGGTNGKSTVVTYLAQLCRNAGLKVGVTTSPHLYSVLERVRVNDETIPASQFEALVHDVDVLVSDVSLTYFDVVTLVALRYFKIQQVDIAIVEVGLGGRLDCANVIDPDVSVLTNVALDHQDRLGDTVELISHEKVRIARPTRPFVYGEGTPNKVVVEYAASHNIPLLQNDRDFGATGSRTAFVSTIDGAVSTIIESGDSTDNFCTALQTARLILDDAEFAAASNASLRDPQGRLQHVRCDGQSWWFDVAHNPAAIRYLREQLCARGVHEANVVFGCLRDKDIASMLSELTSQSTERTKLRSLTLVPSQGRRGVALETLKSMQLPLNGSSFSFGKLAQTVEETQRVRTKVPTVVCGSFEVVARAMKQVRERSQVRET